MNGRMALFALASLIAWPLGSFALPRQPLPPLPEWPLARWSFDDALRQYPFNAAPAAIPEASLVESWSGYALQRTGDRVQTFAVPEISDAAQFNFTADTGAMRFWFKPAWGSSRAGGRGAGSYVRLLELVSVSSGRSTPAVQWSLYATPDGSALYLSGQSESGPRDFFRADLNWAAETWHLVLLAYTPTNSALYLDGELAAWGDPLPFPTAPTAPMLTLVLGSELSGLTPAQGDFDELTTFDRYPSDWALTWYYPAQARLAAQGPVSDAEISAWQARRQAIQESRSALTSQALAVTDGGLGLLRLTEGVECANNHTPYLTNCLATVADGTNWTFGFTIGGGTSGQVYDVLSSTLLGPGLVTNTVWLTNAVPCEDYTFTHQPPSGAFYWLSLPGLSDTDYDGLPDWWETLHGLNPRLANAAGQDSDGDGLPDYQEYLYGSDPRSAPTWGLWVASPSTEGRLP